MGESRGKGESVGVASVDVGRCVGPGDRREVEDDGEERGRTVTFHLSVCIETERWEEGD